MAQHDMNIANQGFPATRADLNNALQALASNNSGTSAPSTTFANQWWYDTTNNKLYIRNEANNAWIQVAVLDQTNNEWQITTGVIQAKDGDGLALKTDDGTTRLFIKDSDGSIGLGHSSPAYQLDLQGGTTNNDRVRLLRGTDDANQFMTMGWNNISTHRADVALASPMTSLAFNQVGSDGTRTAMQIDSSGNVGIGVSPEASHAPSLTVKYGGNNITSRGNADLRILSGAFQDGASTFEYSVSGVAVGMLSMTNGAFGFGTAPSGTDGNAASFTNSMTIHDSGPVTIGTGTIGAGVTFGSFKLGLTVEEQFGALIKSTGGAAGFEVLDLWNITDGTGANIQIYFRDGSSGGVRGSIHTNGSSTTYATTSDYRLKENVTNISDGITRVKQLSPKRFNFIVDADTTVDGFLAHEAQTVVPEAITGTHDGMKDEEYIVTAAKGDVYTPANGAVFDEDGNEVSAATDEVIHSSNVEQPETLEEGQQWRETAEAVTGTRTVPDMQGIDQAKIVPLLTAALQEAIAKIETLETKVAALEG